MTNSQQLKELDKIYDLYGYEKVKADSTARVYVLEQGMYHGAEIINIKGGKLADEFFKEFSNLGYACKKREFKGIEEIQEELFNGFFNLAGSYKRIKSRYKVFSEKQVRHLQRGINYEYVKAPYSIITDSDFKGTDDLISDVLGIIDRSGPFFIIIEAAAGFGKTCTAYEILINIIKKHKGKRPLFAELSKDRTARIFKHVLLSEIDEEYRGSINTDLVRHHINTGKIPFIIDGFDELLSKDLDPGNDIENDFQEIESMLTTIGELLSGNAKIILTSRKTAIFSGEQFDNWRESYPKGFEVFRIAIENPRISDWLDQEKIAFIDSNKRLIHSISNPVLLSLLKFSTLKEFENLIKSPGKIIDKYFNTLLAREQERQNLAIPPQKQLIIFQRLAGVFSEYNINSEERTFLKDFLHEYNNDIIEESLDHYSSSHRPTVEEVVETLTNHALLDRIGSRSDRIGFLNDFVYGMLMGFNILQKNYPVEPSTIPESKAELILAAWRFQDPNKKEELWGIFEKNDFRLSKPWYLNADSYLMGEILHSFEKEQFDSHILSEVTFGDNCKFSECVFINCDFEYCTIDFLQFLGCSFVNCRFINCQIINENNSSQKNVTFYGIVNHGTKGMESLIGDSSYQEESEKTLETESSDIEDAILSLMFKVGGQKPKWKSISNIVKDLFTIDQKSILKEIQRLQGENILQELGNGVKLTMDGIVYWNRKSKKNE